MCLVRISMSALKLRPVLQSETEFNIVYLHITHQNIVVTKFIAHVRVKLR